jgi:aminoglycoside phosphotransferase
MCPGNIDLGDLGVVAHHFQVAMAEQRLQGEEVA